MLRIKHKLNQFSPLAENITLNYAPLQSSSLAEFLQQFTIWFEYQWAFEVSERNNMKFLPNSFLKRSSLQHTSLSTSLMAMRLLLKYLISSSNCFLGWIVRVLR
jgi:hypothetical protein